jgi:hypothetical protein
MNFILVYAFVTELFLGTLWIIFMLFFYVLPDLFLKKGRPKVVVSYTKIHSFFCKLSPNSIRPIGHALG